MTDPAPAKPSRPRYVPAVGPRLRRLLAVVFALFALLTVNSVYLVSVTVAGVQYQNWFYLVMFMGHLMLGLTIVTPVIVFGVVHIRNSRNRPNRRAIRAGYALFAVACLVLATGLVLTRVDVLGLRFEVNQPLARSIAYWAHVIGPLAAIWLFVLHRLAGRRIKWRTGLSWAAVAGVFAGVMLVLQTQDPRAWNVAGPASGDVYFRPSLARTSTGNFIPATVLHNDQYCLECHADIHDSWAHSMHRLSSFNNPVYLFSIEETRRRVLERDGTVHASRFCAACHDPVPFFSGAFDDPAYDIHEDPTADAGITCTACHAIVNVNSPRGNGDFTIEEPVHYPFAFSDSGFLRWVNRQLVKAKPEFHRATFLKPLHESSEFCGACHKVHIPEELNDYKWLRGQNHFDTFWLSGVSGQGIESFYYPAEAEAGCNGCHMPLVPASDEPNFGARVRDESGIVKTVDHQFPSANTGILAMLRDELADADGAIEAHRAFLRDVTRVDLFALRRGGTIDGELLAPVRPHVPMIEPGGTYLLEAVIRTLKLGHHLPQGTTDSNELWLDVEVTAGDRVIGRSGGLEGPGRSVDPWAHFVRSFVIDREGNRIARRNVQDIFIALYDNQIPPGASDVVHYRFTVPPDVDAPVTVRARLLYRKFDTELMRHVTDDPAYVNDLPIAIMAEDEVTFPVRGVDERIPNAAVAIEAWERWNDYGIGLLRKGERGELRQARVAFERVEALGRPDGPLNLTRVFIKEGLIQTDAPDALQRAARFDPPANEWSLLWFGARVAFLNGDYDQAIDNLREIVRGGFVQAQGRGFDFAKDYRVLDQLAAALYQRGLQEKGEARDAYLDEARRTYEKTLEYEPENVAAHWGLKQIHQLDGNIDRVRHHASEHARYKPDDNARDVAVAAARRRYPAADRAAEEVVIYDLQRPGAPGLPDRQEIARHD